MKETTLIVMKNKIEALTNALQQVVQEQQHLKTFAVGTFESVKLMPGYAEALESLAIKASVKYESEK